MDNYVIGIDLGTTNSCAAYYKNGAIEILENAEGGRITPSFVCFSKKQLTNAIVGHYGAHMAKNEPENGIYEIKRFIGKTYQEIHLQNNLQYFSFKVEDDFNDPIIVIQGKNNVLKKTPQEITTIILQKIKTDVEAKIDTVDKAVITVPAYFNTSQREATLKAATDAGFTVLKLLNEPNAAALSYFFKNNVNDECYSLIYDLGGGTFDVSILKKTLNNIDIICVDGDTSLGGKDLDNLIVDYVCEKLKNEYGYDPKSDRRSMRRMQNECETAKKTLSFTPETSIIFEAFVSFHDKVEIDITRKQFEKMGEKLFKRTIEIVTRCVNNSGIGKDKIKHVVLAGGSSRIPKIQELLSAYFDGKTLNKSGNFDECVAEGAALQAAMFSCSSEQRLDKIKITDVIPLSLGIETTCGVMSFIIKKNTSIPTSKCYNFVNTVGNQDRIRFTIFEGERLEANKNRLLHKLTLDNLTPAPPRQCQLILIMNIDQNGILTIKAKELNRNNVKEVKINYARGTQSDKEIETVLLDTTNHEAEDQRFMIFAKKKQYLQGYCASAKYNFEELLRKDDKVYELCKNTFDRLNSLQVGNEDIIEELTKKIKQKCDPIKKKFGFKYMDDL
jgi:molecular chaperone DnaK (HSP70)